MFDAAKAILRIRDCRLRHAALPRPFRLAAPLINYALKMGGTGDVTDSHLLWRYQKSLPDVSSVLLYRGVLYLIRNGGILQTLDPAKGTLIKQGRLSHAMDEYYASPVGSDGKVFMLSRDGKATVLEAGTADWGLAATADFGEEIFATPAIAEGHMWVRTATTLYDFSRRAAVRFLFADWTVPHFNPWAPAWDCCRPTGYLSHAPPDSCRSTGFGV